jgi:hypothetical protein
LQQQVHARDAQRGPSQPAAAQRKQRRHAPTTAVSPMTTPVP